MKKKMVALLTVALLVLPAAGCDLPGSLSLPKLPFLSSQKDTSFLSAGFETELDYGGTPYLYLERMILQLSADSSESYPALAASIDKMNSEIRAFTDDIFSSYKKAENNSSLPNDPTPEITQSAYIMRADNLVLSVLSDTYYYTGGMHGMNYTEGFTYETETGRRLSLSDVVTNPRAFSDIIEKGMDRYQSATEAHALLWENGDYLQWTMDPRGVNVYFNPYEIAPFAAGIPMVHVPFADYPDIFNKKYTGDTPDSYMISIPENIAFCYGTDANQTPLYLYCGSYYEDNDTYFPYFIETDKGRHEEDFTAYDYESIYVKNGGKDYIYAQAISDNDARTLFIYDITGGICKKVDKKYVGFYEPDFPINPKSFSLQHRQDLLSTGFFHRLYTVGEDGLPLPLEKVANLHTPISLTVKSDVEAEVVDITSGKTKSTLTLTAGDRAEYFAADDMDYAYLQLSDGSVCRVKVNHASYPYRISGIDIEDLFEGMLFAG